VYDVRIHLLLSIGESKKVICSLSLLNKKRKRKGVERMFETLDIKPCTDITVRDLIQLHQAGHPVYRTSHAGNWSSYKLILSELGLPDRIWEATCVHRDINNQPQFQLKNGTRTQLVPKLLEKPKGNIKQLTPYQRCADSKHTLSSFHVEPLKKMFGDTVTTQSQELLVFREKLSAIFETVERYAPEFLGRYILPCGCMVPLQPCGDGRHYSAVCEHDDVIVSRSNLAESAVGTIDDLYMLIHEPEGYKPKGGVLYSLELVYATSIMLDFWKHGEKTIYMLSGPDMIKYATKNSFTERIRSVLHLFGTYLPTLTPRKAEVCIVPTTLFRFGYPKGCKVSEAVMAAHETIWTLQKQKRKYLRIPEVVDPINQLLEDLARVIDSGKRTWDLFHDSSKDPFYSQHDLFSSGTRMTVQQQYLNTTFSMLSKMLSSLEHFEGNLLRTVRQ
jgi:hypothetical protein